MSTTGRDALFLGSVRRAEKMSGEAEREGTRTTAGKGDRRTAKSDGRSGRGGGAVQVGMRQARKCT